MTTLTAEAEEHPTLFLAGHPAPAGIYRDIETGREVRLEKGGMLPATCNGRVAAYVRRPKSWAEIYRCDQDLH